MHVVPTIRLLFVIWTNAPFLLHIIEAFNRPLLYLIFAGRKISREENFAEGNFREIPFAVDIIFAGGKFRAKSEYSENFLHAKNLCYVNDRDTERSRVAS